MEAEEDLIAEIHGFSEPDLDVWHTEALWFATSSVTEMPRVHGSRGALRPTSPWSE